MDDRQTKIVEGAGLEESRLNTEFIEWLNIWGFRILLVCLVLAAGWAGKGWWDRHQERQTDEALTALNSAIGSGSPDGLEAVAREWRGKPQVWELAMLEAAELHHRAARLALRPGGDTQVLEDRLAPEQVAAHLSSARALYEQILERDRSSAPTLRTLNARSGLAAVALTELRIDDAKAILNQLAADAARAGFPELERRARQRAAEVDKWRDWPGPPTYAFLEMVRNGRGPIAMFGETPENFFPPSSTPPAQGSGGAAEGGTPLLGPFGGVGSETPPADDGDQPADEEPAPTTPPGSP